MKLTIFTGTFNPIHTAHLILAESVRTALDLKKIVFIPSFIPPHREKNLAGAEHRLNMTKIAVADNPYFEVNNIEFKMNSKSYTINTIKKLYEECPGINGKINFIIGADSFLDIETWHNSSEFVKLVNFIILARTDSPKITEIINNIKFKNIDYTIIKTPIVDISSSDIREKIKKGKSIKYLVNERVREYIQENGLYNNSH